MSSGAVLHLQDEVDQLRSDLRQTRWCLGDEARKHGKTKVALEEACELLMRGRQGEMPEAALDEFFAAVEDVSGFLWPYYEREVVVEEVGEAIASVLPGSLDHKTRTAVAEKAIHTFERYRAHRTYEREALTLAEEAES